MRTTSRAPASRARPRRSSTVTPGKFATFCRRPVRRLKSVDLPEFGGPTRATRRGARDRGVKGGGGRSVGRGGRPWVPCALTRFPPWRSRREDAVPCRGAERTRYEADTSEL